MTKLLAILALLRKGSEVTNPESWKDRATVLGIVTAVLWAAAAFNFLPGLDQATVSLLATVISDAIVPVYVAFLFIVHLISSRKSGIPFVPPVVGSASPIGNDAAAYAAQEPPVKQGIPGH